MEAELEAILAALKSVTNELTNTNSLLQANTMNAGVTNTSAQRNIEDVGATEADEANLSNQVMAWNANSKRTFDEYQDISLEGIRRNREHFDTEVSDAHAHTQSLRQSEIELRAITTQNAQNAAQVYYALAQQGMAKSDVAFDRVWNAPEELLVFKGIMDKAALDQYMEAFWASKMDNTGESE